MLNWLIYQCIDYNVSITGHIRRRVYITSTRVPPHVYKQIYLRYICCEKGLVMLLKSVFGEELIYPYIEWIEEYITIFIPYVHLQTLNIFSSIIYYWYSIVQNKWILRTQSKIIWKTIPIFQRIISLFRQVRFS